MDEDEHEHDSGLTPDPWNSPMLHHLLQLADESRDEIVGLARDLVRLETVNTGTMPTGGETAAADLLREFLRRGGIEEVELLARDPARANLVARLPGHSEEARLLLLGHTDVVPPGDVSLWAHDPFGGEVDGGRLYGRGAADMKGTVVAQVMALVLLQRAGVRLRHSLRLACVADEESGGAWGMGWLAGAHPDRIRADFCLNEGGGSLFELDGTLCCILSLGEKGRHEATFHVNGRGAHASQPWLGENAFYPLARLLSRIEAYQPERRVDLPLFDALAPRIGWREPVTPENVDAFCDRAAGLQEPLGSACRALSRMTLVPSLLSGGVKSNSVPERALLRCDVRSLPEQDRAYVESELGRIAAELPVARIELETTASPSQSPFDAAIAAALEQAARAGLGRRVTMIPGLGTGFTDSRFARAAGVPAYGCTPGHPANAGLQRGAHGPDEWTGIDDLIAGTRFFLAATMLMDELGTNS